MSKDGMSKDGMPKDVALMHVTLKVGVISRSICICFESKICFKKYRSIY